MRTSTRIRTALIATLAGAAMIAAACSPAPAASKPLNPLTLGTNFVVGNGSVTSASISYDGTWTAFTSTSTNLVAGDNNGLIDLFLRQRNTSQTIRVKENVNGGAYISTNGQYVAYRAVTGELGVYNRINAARSEWTSSLISPTTPVVAPDGGTAVYGSPVSFGLTPPGCFARDLASGVETPCPAGGPGAGTTAYETTSANTRYVIYYWNDLGGFGTSGWRMWDRVEEDVTTLDPSIVIFPGYAYVSDDGRYIAATSTAPGVPFNTVVADLETLTITTQPIASPNGATVPVEISSDGSKVLIQSEASNLVPNDTNGAVDMFIWDRTANTVKRISRYTDTSNQLPNGAGRCGNGPGQFRSDGTGGCGLTTSPAAAVDTNGLADGYMMV